MQTGGIEVIQKTTRPFPQQKADEFLIKVRLIAYFVSSVLILRQVEYGGVNFIDTYFR
jgi:NADPH2:quinone reductase